jgi:hypothetical protein
MGGHYNEHVAWGVGIYGHKGKFSEKKHQHLAVEIRRHLQREETVFVRKTEPGGIERSQAKRTKIVVLSVMLLSGSVYAGGMRWPVGISYIDGFKDIADLYEENDENELRMFGIWWADTDVDVWPVGISFHPYYLWDNGFRLGAGIGPAMFVYGDVYHFQLPININAGYTFMPDGPVSPYLFAGPSYHFANGDYVDGSDLGFVGGVGVELLKRKTFNLAVQITYDSAEVDIKELSAAFPFTPDSEGIQGAEWLFSVLFVFK